MRRLPCPRCTGSVTVSLDVTDRSLLVAVDGIVGEQGSCTIGACGETIDVDAFLSRYFPCDGGSCVAELPCNDGGIFGPGSAFCPNPNYKGMPIAVKARTSITE